MLNAFLHFKKNFNLSLVLEKKQKTRLAHRVNGQSRMVNTSFKEFGFDKINSSLARKVKIELLKEVIMFKLIKIEI